MRVVTVDTTSLIQGGVMFAGGKIIPVVALEARRNGGLQQQVRVGRRVMVMTGRTVADGDRAVDEARFGDQRRVARKTQSLFDGTH
jgi:hypothetical protein